MGGEAPEQWATMPLEELMRLLQTTTQNLGTQIESCAVDDGAYQRKFWSHWQTLDASLSVAAMTRECEWACKELYEVRAIGQGLVESYRVKRDALVAILAARAR